MKCLSVELFIYIAVNNPQTQQNVITKRLKACPFGQDNYIKDYLFFLN